MRPACNLCRHRPPPTNQVQPHQPRVPDGKLSDDTGHFQNPVSRVPCPSPGLSDESHRHHATIVPARPRQTPPTSLTMPAGWCLSASPPPPRVRLRSFRAETFHGLTKPSRDSRTSRCLFCASPSSRSGSHRRRVRPDVLPTRLGCPGPPRAETEARIMTHGASVAMLMPPWPGAISPSPSPLPRATAENTGWHRQGTQDSPTEVLGNMVLVFQNGGNRRVSGPSLQSQDLRSCDLRRAPTDMDGRLPDRRGSLEPPDSQR